MITYKVANNGLSVNKFYNGEQVGGMLIEAEEYKQWLSEGNSPEPEFTEVELAQQLEAAKPKVLTPKQARLALLGAGLYDAVNQAVKANPAHEIYWEYALEVKRDDSLLLELASVIGLSSEQIDALFIAGSVL